MRYVHRLGRKILGGVTPFFLVCLWLTSANPASAQKPADAGWVGKEVIGKAKDFCLEVDGKVVKRTEGRIVVYRVEGVEGDKLRLHCVGTELEGWAASTGVVELERAIAYLSEAIHANPQDAHDRILRG